MNIKGANRVGISDGRLAVKYTLRFYICNEGEIAAYN